MWLWGFTWRRDGKCLVIVDKSKNLWKMVQWETVGDSGRQWETIEEAAAGDTWEHAMITILKKN